MQNKLTKIVMTSTILASLLAGFFLPIHNVSAVVKDNHTSATTQNQESIYGTMIVAQGVTPTSTYSLSKISLNIGRVNSPSGNTTFAIWSDTGTHYPAGGLAGALRTGTILTTDIPTSSDWIDIELSAPITITSGQQYFVGVSQYPNGDASKTVTVATDNTGDNYAGTYNRKIYYDGVNWTEYTDRDLIFKLWDSSIIQNEVETIGYILGFDNVTQTYSVNMTGHVINDGGNTNTVSFNLIHKFGAPSPVIVDAGTAEIGDTFSANYTGLSLATWYQFNAQGSNGSYTSAGSLIDIYTSTVTDIPTMSTQNYVYHGSYIVEFYGQVAYDGGSDTTAGIQYWLSSTPTSILYSTNITGLQSFDSYSANITLTPDVEYTYRAYGLNDTGFGYGGTGTIIIYTTITAPTVTTDNATQTGNTSQFVLSGNITAFNGETQYSIAGFQYRVSGETWINSATTEVLPSGLHTFQYTTPILVLNKTYEYRALAINIDNYGNSLTGYGEIKVFSTFGMDNVPIVTTDNATFMGNGSIRLFGTLIYDGNLGCLVFFEWQKIEASGPYGTTPVPASEGDTFYATIYNLETNIDYEYRAVGGVGSNLGYGAWKYFKLTGSEVIGEPPPSGGVGGEGISKFVNDLKTSLGLTGTMGTWAFMGLLILLVSLIFGIAIVATQEHWIKTAIAVAWLLTSVSIVGAFIFTGQLGAWPILIMVGGVVVFIMILISIKFSGGGVDG